jgi:hypothetical protein
MSTTPPPLDYALQMKQHILQKTLDSVRSAFPFLTDGIHGTPDRRLAIAFALSALRGEPISFAECLDRLTRDERREVAVLCEMHPTGRRNVLNQLQSLQAMGNVKNQPTASERLDPCDK